MELTDIEARVVGAMIEKAFLTPDIYPMTTNALVTACNQKTNRDPVVSYDAITIDAALLELRQRGIVRRVHTPGSRSTKHRHTLDEALELDDEQLAVVSVLLLRGAQTVGELRLRTERQIGFDSIEAVESVLEALAGRPTPLVRELARQPGQKENRWVHLLHDPEAGAQPSGEQSSGAPATAAPAATAVPASSDADPSNVPAPAATPTAAATPVDRAAPATFSSTSADADLVARVEALETELTALRRQLHGLAGQLGESLD